MKYLLKRKLRSSQGMTLLLSLLLFLVCAVAGSVVLTAGTATSGTLSERAKLDQRYFSVTSAAELIRETFNGKSVTVTVTGNTVDVAIQRPSVPKPQDVKVKRDDGKWVEVESNKQIKSEEAFVIDQSLYLLDKRVNSPNEDDPQKIVWTGDYQQIIDNRPESSIKYELVINIDDNDDNAIDSEKLKTTVTVNFKLSGNLTFQLENANGDTEKFRLQMEYTGGILEEASESATTYHIDWQTGTISYGN